jgi:hypothetical protein
MERVLGVAIGIAVVCLLLSIIASHLQEVWATYTARRAASLVSAIESMLGKDVADDFFAHPLIQTISFTAPRVAVSLHEGTVQPKKKVRDDSAPRPTYIAASLFSRVLFAVLRERHDMQGASIDEIVSKLPDVDLKRRLAAVIAGTGQQAHASALAVEQWYDGTMDRINGLYKKNTQQILLYFGIVLAILCNANLFMITEKLWSSEDARIALNATAQMYSCKDPAAKCTDQDYRSAREDMSERLENYIPVGYHHTGEYWKSTWDKLQGPNASASSYASVLWGWILNLAGWGLTGIAVSLGAPFWFDAVNKLINIRLAGDKPPRTEPSGIGDQPNPPPADPAVVNLVAPQINAPVVNVTAPDPAPDAGI